MKAKLRRSSWIVTVPLVAIAAGYILLVFLPERRAVGRTRDQIRQKQDYIARAVAVATALSAAEQQLNKTRAYNTAWKQHAPVESELSALYGKIHQLAETAGATLSRFDPEPAVRHDRICEIRLRMDWTGSFGEICGLLEGLEGLPMSIWTSELCLRPSAGDGGAVRCEAELRIFADNSNDSDYVDRSE